MGVDGDKGAMDGRLFAPATVPVVVEVKVVTLVARGLVAAVVVVTTLGSGLGKAVILCCK